MEKRNKKHDRFHSIMSKEQTDALQGTEIQSKRTRFGKVFALGANRFQAVTYTDPVHRFNEQTHEWDEIDNRFAATPRMQNARAAWKQGVMPAVERGEALLECKTGNLDIDCGMAGEAPFITLTDPEGRKLSWGIEGAVSILPETEESTDIVAENVRGMREKVLNRLHGEVVYGGIFNGVDMRCKLDRGFKDELIFIEQESVRPVTFLLQSEGRRMELTEQGGLIVKDAQDKTVFRLQAPFLKDTCDQHGPVAVQLEVRENGVYAMTYTPDAAFMENAAFPVVLDPALEIKSTDDGIVDTYVEKNNSENKKNLDRLWICDNSTQGTCNAYLRVNTPPTLGTDHYITSAYLCVKNYASLSAETPLVMSEVLDPWEPDSITYDTQPRRNSLYQDTCTFPAKNTSNDVLSYVWRELDVTSLARKWYAGENYGVVFTPAPTTPNSISLASSEGSSKPYFVVNYASLAGLESYLTYDHQPCGLAGTGSVSLVNGNLIFAHSDTAMNGNRMPVSITHYYNSCTANQNDFGMGYGWRTSLHQTLHKETINGEAMYVYTDGDGTEHYFERDESNESKYTDMSGLSLTMTVAADQITIVDKGDNLMTFPAVADKKVLISTIQDAMNNKVTVTPVSADSLLIESVKDGAGRVTNFTYVDGLCTEIRTPWQQWPLSCTRFSYTNDELTLITHEDRRKSLYSYQTRNGCHLLTSTGGSDNTPAIYEYSNTNAVDGLPYCVTRARVIGSQASPSLTISDKSYTYGNHMTLVTDNLSSSAPEERKTLRYHFNDNGNQVSIDDELGYAVYTRYDQTDDNASAPINHATVRSRMQRVVKNLLADSMFELNSTAWEKSSSGVTRDASAFQWGIASWKLAANTTGRYLRQAVTLTAGQAYTFSGYLRSSAEKSFLRVIYTVNGEEKYFDSDPVQAHASPSDKPFSRVAVSFTLPEGANTQVYCAVMSIGSSGYAWASCLQLEEGLTCNHFNMLQDQGFTSLSASSAAAACWRVASGTLSAHVSTKALSACTITPPEHLTGRALHFTAHYDPDYGLVAEQEIKVSGSEGDRFTVGGWCSSFAKAHNEANGVYCCIDVQFPSGSYWVSGGKAIFNYEEGNWQFASAGIKAPNPFTKIRVRVNMTGQMNEADVTGLFLYPEAFGMEYTYDAKGNRTASKQLYGSASDADYDDCDNLTRYKAPGHSLSTTYNYGATEEQQKKHLLLNSLSPLGTYAAYTYDTYGNVTETKVSAGSATATPFIKTKTTYTDSENAVGNYVKTQTDARGKVVTTATDTNRGTVTSVTDPKGQTVAYEYDTLCRVTKVSTTAGNQTCQNEYTYDGTTGHLTSVAHNTTGTACDVQYNFTYDAMGRKVGVAVGSQALSTNEYQNNTALKHYGTLTRMRYGNGFYVRNEYDDFNRVEKVYCGKQTNGVDADTLRYEYAYNAKGQVAHVVNHALDQVTESEYDLADRPCRIKTHEADGTHIYTGEAAYDETRGNLSEFREVVGDERTEYTTTFGYDEEDRPTALTYTGYGSSTNTYDKLGRVTNSTVTVGSKSYPTAFTFVAGGQGTGSTTGLVESITQTGGNCSYEYDDNGNILTATVAGKTAKYTYDALGQLTRVDDQSDTTSGSTGTTWVYEYDCGGNITAKKRYGYTTGALGDVKQTITYGYDTVWKDKLTSYNGASISYDDIGNPTSDGTWTYTWENGRQLQKMQKSGETVEFVYNENGLRVQKTATTTGATYYTLHGKNIVHMKQGSNSLHFFYDAQNKPAVVVYNGTAYAYAKNLQGDIIAILNSAGTAVVNYTYDAWGKPTSTTGTMKDTLGKLNPFRYRSYVYDEETELYYLRSRYYGAESSRFVNSDRYLLDKNLYSYCKNTPINQVDADGQASYTFLGNGSDDPINTYISDAMCLGGGGYYVDFSMAINSSVWHSPLLNGEWAGYYIHTPATYSLDRGYAGYSGTGSSNSVAAITIPQKATNVLNHLKAHKFSPMSGYKGGRTFSNDGRDGSGSLPSKYAPFQEFDIDPKVKGQPRNSERIVVGFGNGGAAWYTPDHYATFYLMEEDFIK